MNNICTMRYYRRHSIQIPACPACPFFKPSTATQGTSQSRRRRATKDSTITTTPTKTSSSSAVDYSEWDAAMNSLLEEEGKQQASSPSSRRRVPSSNRRNDMMMRKSTRTWATSFTTASTNNIESSDAPHSSPIVVNRVQKEADIYIYTINDSDESSISSMEDSICSKKEDDNKKVDWERLERYIEQEDDIEDCFAYALDMGVLIQSRSRSSDDDDDDCCYNSNSCQGGDLLDGEKQTTGKKKPQKFASDGIVCGGRLEQMRVRCPAA